MEKKADFSECTPASLLLEQGYLSFPPLQLRPETLTLFGVEPNDF
jgi:hypothetical protein